MKLKLPKASKIPLFIDDNFYNDAVKWLETRNEDSKDRTNVTSQDVTIMKRKGWRVAQYHPRTEKISSKMSTTPSSLPSPFEYCSQRKSDKMDKYIKRKYK